MDQSSFDRLDRVIRMPGDIPLLFGAAPVAPPYFGVNLDPSSTPVFANIVRHAYWFAPASNPGAGANVPLDQFLCPTTDFALSLPLLEPIRGTGGDTYAITFAGRATVTCTNGGGTVTGPAYDAASNTTTATLAMPAGPIGDNFAWLVFTGTRRLPGDPLGNGLDARQLFVMRPIAPGATEHHATTEEFNRQLKVALAPFQAVRDLDCRITNNVPGFGTVSRDQVIAFPARTPANRTPPYSPLQFPLGETAGNSPSRGMSFEAMVRLCNWLGADLWTNLEDNGTAELYQLYVNIARYGSDPTGAAYTAAGGANPAPSTLPGGATPPLAGRLIFEMGNENWNPLFSQLTRYDDRGGKNIAALNTNNDAAGLNPRFCQVASDLLTVADMCRVAWPGGLGTRYAPIFCTQTGNDPTLGDGLTWLQRRLAHRGETVAQNIVGTGGDSYEGYAADDNDPNTPATAANLDALFASGVVTRSGLPITPGQAAAFGLAATTYEGGLTAGYTPLGLAAQHDPRIGPAVRDRVWNLVDCGYAYITLYALQRTPWSVLDSIHDLTHPKWVGWRDAAAAYYPIVGGAIVPRPTPSAPSFADPSFEAVRLRAGEPYRFSPIVGSPWSFTGGAGINGPATGIINAGQGVPTGTQVGFIQGSGSISQAVAGLTPGSSYAISGRMVGWLAYNSASFDVLVDGASIGTFNPPKQANFVPFAPTFRATAASHSITFRASGPGTTAVMLDALAIMPVASIVPARPSIRNGRAYGIVLTIGVGASGLP